MKTTRRLLLITLSLGLSPFNPRVARAAADDPGWPRVFKKDGKQLTVYQPQVEYWYGYTNLHFRAAIAIKASSSQAETFGVLEADTVTVVDHNARIVAIVPVKRELRFPNTTDAEAAALRRIVDELKPPGEAVTLSLDRVLAYLTPANAPEQKSVEVNLNPPKIFYSRTPAILVIFMGEPQYQPVATNRTDLMFALNTNWDLFYDTAGGQYYLLNGESWFTTGDMLKGPWTPAKTLPPALYSLPPDDNWVEVRQQLPGKTARNAPVVFASTEPAEMIVTEGEPSYSPIPGTRLLRMTDTDSALFLNSADGKFYFLTAGRWFRAASLTGPWSSASADLPVDFARIPDNNPAAYVKASVPGTREAQDAVLLASVPTATTVLVTNVTVQAIYNGPPQFTVIQGTTVQYAVNSPNQLFLVSGRYYWCNQGAWLRGATANGPWTFCTAVPAAIYTIPPSNPNYNVTYVVVQSSTPTTVTYSQTAGYSGQYVAATGVLMFGMGMLAGAAIANNNSCSYCYPPPCYYSYGCGAMYRYGHGGYYSAAHYYGPYGGAGRAAAYNPYTGTYSRGAYAYGPYGSASARQAYNPYTGGYAQSARVNTAYGSAGRFYASQGGESAWGGYRSTSQGTVAGVRTSEGSGAAAWDTRYGQGAVGKSQSGDIYAAKDGTVYKKDSNGGWSQNSGSGWNSVEKPAKSGATSYQTASGTHATTPPSTTATRSPTTQPSTTRAPTQPTTTGARTPPSSFSSSSVGSQLNSDSKARSWGNQQSQQTSQYRSSGGISREFSGGSRRK